MALERDLGQSGRMASVDVTDARSEPALRIPALDLFFQRDRISLGGRPSYQGLGGGRC
jgi:hypothetical protein